MQRAHALLPIVLFTLAGGAAAQDWPQFRGSDGRATASAPDLPVDFTLADATWRVELAGSGHSSPVVSAGRVFVTSHVDGEDTRVVQCLSTADGAELWAVEIPFEPYQSHQLNSRASTCPTADGERVYLAWPDGEHLVALALDLEGELVWRKELGSRFAKHGGGTSPVLVDGVLVISNDNESNDSFLVGLEPATGDELWRRERKSSKTAFATPVVYRDSQGDPQVLFASTSHGLTSLDPHTGKLLWEVEGLFSDRCVATPVVLGNLVFTTAGSGSAGKESAAVHIPQHGEQARLQFRARRSLPYVPSPVAHGEHIFTFGDGGIVSCLSSRTGKSLWRERVTGEFYGSPIAIDDRLYAINKEGVLVVLAADDDFQLLGTVDLGEPSNATPAVSDGVLYLRTERHLCSVGEPRTE